MHCEDNSAHDLALVEKLRCSACPVADATGERHSASAGQLCLVAATAPALLVAVGGTVERRDGRRDGGNACRNSGARYLAVGARLPNTACRPELPRQVTVMKS